MSGVRIEGNVLHVAFSAARVRTGDSPERTGHVRSLVLSLALSGPAPASPGDGIGALAAGVLDVAGRPPPAPLPVPCELGQPCRLELDFANGSHLAAQGRSAVFWFAGEPRFAEDLSC